MLRVALFVAIFGVYQTAEALQTVLKRGSALGPILMLTSLLVAALAPRLVGKRPALIYGLELHRDVPQVLLIGLLLAVLAKLAALFSGLATGAYAPAAEPIARFTSISLLIAALATFVPSIVEDILTRGLLLRAPLKLNFCTYTFGSAALYTLNHIWRLDWGLSEQLRLFCLGLAFGAAAWRWNSLWAAVALHWGWNLSSAIAEQAIPLDTTNVISGRYVSAAACLSLFIIIALLAVESIVPRDKSAVR